MNTTMQTLLKKGNTLRHKVQLPRVFIYVFLIIMSYMFLYPFLYMIVTSLKSQADLFDVSINWIPSGIEWQNWRAAFVNLDFAAHIWNSLLIVSVCTLGHIFSCAFIAYGFARYRFPLKGLWFVLVVLTIIIPSQVIILPLYLTYSEMGWLNTYLPLMVPCFFGFGLRGGIMIFLFRQFFIGLPRDLENAAKIDGCSFMGAYFRIAFPTARSSILVCFVLSVVWHWNDYYEPVIYLGKSSQWPLPAMLPTIYEKYLAASAELTTNADSIITRGVLMAAALLVIAVVLLLYCVVQRQFIQGLEHSGLSAE